MTIPAAILTWALMASSPSSSPPAAPSAQDSVITGVCEGALTSIGVILPSGGLGMDCGPALTLRHGWRDGDPGTYVLLDLPSCPDNWCRSLQTSDRLRCEILIGNPCCYIEDLKGKELHAFAGTRIGPITDALQGRFDADTDRREGLCHDQYLGNQARVLRVLIVEPASDRGRDTYRVLGGGRLFLRARQNKSDDVTGEMVPAPPPAE
jgi:hypothetical protein